MMDTVGLMAKLGRTHHEDYTLEFYIQYLSLLPSNARKELIQGLGQIFHGILGSYAKKFNERIQISNPPANSISGDQFVMHTLRVAYSGLVTEAKFVCKKKT